MTTMLGTERPDNYCPLQLAQHVFTAWAEDRRNQPQEVRLDLAYAVRHIAWEEGDEP